MSVQKCHRKRTFGKENYKDVTAVSKWIWKNWGLEGVNSVDSGTSTEVGCFQNSCLIKGGLLDQLNYYQLSKNSSAPQNLTLRYL